MVPELQAPLTSLLWELAVKPALAPRLAAAAVAAALMPALSAHQVRHTGLSAEVLMKSTVSLAAAALVAYPPVSPSGQLTYQASAAMDVCLYLL